MADDTTVSSPPSGSHHPHQDRPAPDRRVSNRSVSDRAESGRPGTGRTVHLQRTGALRFRAVNERGGVIELGNGTTEEFSPVELLLAAVAACTAMDVDAITGKRGEPSSFEVDVHGRKVRDGEGNHLDDLWVDFAVRFGDDEGGRAAAAVLPIAVQRSHDRLCTVSRTVELPSPIQVLIDGQPVGDR